MQIQRALHIPAPPGDAVHAMAQAYTGLKSRRMLEYVTHHAFNGSYYYTRRLYRRITNDNGATWRIAEPAFETRVEKSEASERGCDIHYLDPRNGRLVHLYSTWKIRQAEAQFDSQTTTASYRVVYEISSDEGLTWTPPRPVIHRGAGFDATRWLPAVTHGKNGAYCIPVSPCRLDEGAFVLGLAIHPLSEDGKSCRTGWFDTAFLRASWTPDGQDLEWEQSAPITVTNETASGGCCEADLLHIRGDKLFTTMRCQGDAGRGLASSRQGSFSTDGGRTWSAPKILSYDDGKPVYVPAAFSSFLRSPLTGKVWWFANILDRPVPAQYPRCPLCMAEFDTERLCLIRNSVQIVQDLPPGAPPCKTDRPVDGEDFGRQYTNFGAYVDRETDEMVLVMPEMPKVSWADFTSDCILFRIRDY
ncbi:MAG: exo-alpha-sialidase [Lentisphaerae bacterium]|nr:exo-alpha-sialidase [Lentisphaerota bacterium]